MVNGENVLNIVHIYLILVRHNVAILNQAPNQLNNILANRMFTVSMDTISAQMQVADCRDVVINFSWIGVCINVLYAQ